MTDKLLLGPLLGLESDTDYTFCFLTDRHATSAKIKIGHQNIDAKKVATTYSGIYWRAEYDVSSDALSGFVAYTILVNDKPMADGNGRMNWKFFIPDANEEPKFAYASCNGFSNNNLKTCTENPYILWERMLALSAEEPFSLLILGGDQIYADAIWTRIPALDTWNDLGLKEKIKYKPKQALGKKLDWFYEKLYLEQWNKPSVSLALATIPNIMMWDDHDIIDGWGSYPEALQTCDVYKEIYKYASKYFQLFQIRSADNKTLLAPKHSETHFSFGLSFRKTNILALDNRSQRSLKTVMDNQHWHDVKQHLESVKKGSLLILSAIPVVYRDFSFSEASVDFTPWEEELTDDLKDHWRAKEHQGERAKFLMCMLQNAAVRKSKTVILSGDVHLGCMGVVQESKRDQTTNIHQIVSSGIVHPAPSLVQWLGILAITNDRTEYLDENRQIRIDMIKPHGSDHYLRTRNFVTLKEGTDAKLWINWICENNDSPVYPLQ